MSNEEESYEDQETDYGPLCTYAVTGPKPHFQGIYLCHTCSKKVGDGDDEEQLMPLCICYNCSVTCHEEKGHDVEYIGEGPCYCDCASFSNCCALAEKSNEVAMKLNIRDENGNICSDLAIHAQLPNTSNPTDTHADANANADGTNGHFPFVCDVYDIASLRPCDGLIEQALELIEHTRDTHWVSWQRIQGGDTSKGKSSKADNGDDDGDGDGDDDGILCELEQLASSIFQRHVEAYNLTSLVENSSHDIGAEWWVQVKKTNDTNNPNNPNSEDENDKELPTSVPPVKNESIDLHYDKDEELASAFDIGSFPTLSTVTYLTDGTFGNNDNGEFISAPPTLVFAHTHEMVNNGPMGQSLVHTSTNTNAESSCPQMIMSYARKGKHLCFDGRLLHGASSDILLRQTVPVQQQQSNEGNSRLVKKEGLRVTFLVNIWLTRRPSRFISLPNHIRSAIIQKSVLKTKAPLGFIPQEFHDLEMHQKEIMACHIPVERGGDDGDLIENSEMKRIQLPFVSNNATWIDDNDDDENNDDGDDEINDDNEINDDDENSDDASMGESGLVVSIIPPPKTDITVDTIAAYYEDSLEPQLIFIGDESDIDTDDDDEKNDDNYESIQS